MAGMLYYPFINVPEPVAYRAMLYCDHLATIRPVSMDPHLESRIRHGFGPNAFADGFYEPISLLKDGDEFDLDRMDQGWSGVLDKILDLPADDLLVPENVDLPYWSVILHGKLGSAIESALVDAGLARRPGGRDEVLAVSPTVQMMVISALVDTVVRARPDLRPHTDRQSAHDLAIGEHDHWPEFHSANHFWIIELGDSLPVPAPGTPLDQVWEFRVKYDNERQRLVATVDKFIESLRSFHPDHGNTIRRLHTEVRHARDDMTAAGKASRISWIKRSLYTSIAIGVGYLGSKISPDLGWLTGIIGGAAVNLGTTPGHRYERDPIDVSYLHRLDKEIGNSPA
ncbi:DUF6236 family protein [Actinokineospora enzanensis]|uniref:DUF6236 family protein n=1 Tax=Actinokineospora enzanensis TaxID=155975 RepID=UPI0003A11172|nr:DUF6236 family protein [Actinokineospora enzanensis]